MEYTRSIDAVAYRKKLEAEKICCARSDEFLSGLEVAIANLGDMETIEVTHGQWQKQWHDNNLIGHMYEECSICGCIISDTEKFWDCNYCPNCGANMNK